MLTRALRVIAPAALLLSTGCAMNRAAAPPAYPGYVLVWHDEFNTDGLVNSNDWIYETGLVRNNEAQWYQPQNVSCKGGMLVIEGRRESTPNPSFEKDSKDWKRSREQSEYTSGSIKTRGKHEWTFGRFEMRGRIDIRAGLWPAFWTLGVARPWPGCGEIDIMEFYRRTLLANAAWASPKPYAAIWDDTKVPIEKVAKDAGYDSPETWATAFHVWRMDWNQDAISLYVDDHLMNQIDLGQTVNESVDHANPFHEPQHIILNLAIGSTGGDPSKTELPARFEVDWVRVYQARP